MIYLKNPVNEMIISCPTGFSWTNFFFGVFVPLLRGDLKYTIIQLIAAGLTAGISWLVFPFFYNKLYIKSKLEKGFIASDDYSHNYLLKNGYLSK